jgi:hypothetical protein
MAIDKNAVSVPAQSKDLDTTRVTTTYGLVHRQVITLADPETPTSYATLTGSSLNVNVSNASLAVSAASLPLPTGAATATLQTTGNNTLSNIDTKLGGTLSVNVGLTDAQLRASAVPISFTRLASGTDSVTIVPSGTQAVSGTVSATQSGTWNVNNISGTVSLPTGAATESTLVALSAKVVNGYSFHRSASNATTTIKSGAGVLKRVTVNTLGSALNTCTIYDNTAGSGTIIAVIDPTLARGTFEYDVVFNTGLTIVTAIGSAADLTIVYQ